MQGADLGTLEVARVGRIAVGDVLEPGFDERHPLLVAGPGQQQPGEHDAPLPAVDADRPGHGQLLLEVGVLEHDVRRLAPQLEEEALQGGGALLHDPAADRSGTGERDEVDPGIDDQVLGHLVVRRGPTTWSTPGGKSVRSATSRPIRVAFHGVFGAAFRITVLPVAREGPSLFMVTSNG